MAHKWTPIEDLAAGDLATGSNELGPLASVWNEQQASLSGSQSLREFNVRLTREWAIETGVLERIYSLDRGVTQLLIEKGIDAALIPDESTDKAPEHVAGIILDQQSAVDWLFELVKEERPLTEAVVRELHALMTRKQETATGVDQTGQILNIPLNHGEYKLRPNNPTRADGSVYEYCPPEQVPGEMERLLDWHQSHLDRAVAPEVAAAWLHHRFTQIHPFQDGNGRVARALASLVFLRAHWFPLVVNRDHRVRYLDALERADQGDIASLVDLFTAIQRKAFVNALGIARDVLREAERVDQVVEAIGELFRSRDAPLIDELAEAKQLAVSMWTLAGERFSDVARQVSTAIKGPGARRHVFTDEGSPEDSDRSRWHRWQIIESARALGYYANLAEFACWRRICMETENGRAEVLLAFHGVGPEYRGVVGASVAFYRKLDTDDDSQQVVDHHVESDEVFQINYKESEDALRQRFLHWLDRALVNALETWRRGE